MVPNNTFLSQPIFIKNESPLADLTLKGSNEKKLLIVSQKLPTEELDLLTKILEAIQHDLEKDCHLLQIPDNQSFAMCRLVANNDYKKVICFGSEMHQIGFNLRARNYQPILLENCTYIFSDPISKIKANNALKAALWNTLQKIF